MWEEREWHWLGARKESTMALTMLCMRLGRMAPARKGGPTGTILGWTLSCHPQIPNFHLLGLDARVLSERWIKRLVKVVQRQPSQRVRGLYPVSLFCGYFPQVSDHTVQGSSIPLTSLFHSDRIYHEAHYQLRKQNKFVFANSGSDLTAITSSIGPLKRHSGACGHSPLRSLLANVKFHLGDEDLFDHADGKVHAFRCALRCLRPKIIARSKRRR